MKAKSNSSNQTIGQKIYLTAAVAIMLVSGSNFAMAHNPMPGKMRQAREYVLAACLKDRYETAAAPISSEAAEWAGGIVENGDLSGEAYPALAELAKTAPQPGMSQKGTKMILQSCVDFVSSRDFASKVKNILK